LAALVEPEGEVVVRADPLGGVYGPGLQGDEQLAAGEIDRGGTEPLQHLASQAGDAHLQSLEVGQAVDLLVEPAAHLDAGVARRLGDQAEAVIELGPELQAAAEIHPGVHLLGGQAEGHRGEELGRFVLSFPVVGRPVAHLCSTA